MGDANVFNSESVLPILKENWEGEGGGVTTSVSRIIFCALKIIPVEKIRIKYKSLKSIIQIGH